jgi:hypothetical protein
MSVLGAQRTAQGCIRPISATRMCRVPDDLARFGTKRGIPAVAANDAAGGFVLCHP